MGVPPGAQNANRNWGALKPSGSMRRRRDGASSCRGQRPPLTPEPDIEGQRGEALAGEGIAERTQRRGHRNGTEYWSTVFMSQSIQSASHSLTGC
jgi:hypothetical protein